MAKVDERHVEIGYLEECDAWKLESRFFPSKLGGKPAWLDLKNISVNLNCETCSKPCVFLCQVYAPLDDKADCFHRMLYVFICRDPKCCIRNNNSNLKVYRCQLPKENEFYSPEDPPEDLVFYPNPHEGKCSKTCSLCGGYGPHQCAKCKTTNYCSKEHQVHHWKSGHKENCGTNNEDKMNSILFPEFEIMTEAEIYDEDVPEPEVVKTNEEKLKDYNRLLMEGNGGTLQDVEMDVIEQYAFGQDDKYIKKLKAKIELCPDQVIRYERGGQPLWIAKPSPEAVPACPLCGAERQFEFQILSTLLSHLGVDNVELSIDWGTLVVYTCANSCNSGPTYKPEFLRKQDV